MDFKKNDSILFICTGNTCRSPMAEYLMRKLAEENNISLNIYSRGIAAVEGGEMSEYAIEVLEEEGIKVKNFKSSQLTIEDLEKADHIFVMTNAHKKYLMKLVPHLKEKIKMLGDKDIVDPFGKSLRDYRKCMKQIYEELKKLFEKE